MVMMMMMMMIMMMMREIYIYITYITWNFGYPIFRQTNMCNSQLAATSPATSIFRNLDWC